MNRNAKIKLFVGIPSIIIIILLLIHIMAMGTVMVLATANQSTHVVVLYEPTDGSFSSSATVDFNWTVSGNATEYNATVYANWVTGTGSTYVKNQSTTVENISVTTQNGTRITNIRDGEWRWNVTAVNNSDDMTSAGTAFAYYVVIVDTTAPVINSVLSPTTGSINNTAGLVYSLDITEENPSTCDIYSNTTDGTYKNIGTAEFFNTTVQNFTYPLTSIDGNGWVIGAVCFDDAGNAGEAANVSITIDTVNPAISDVAIFNSNDLTNFWSTSQNITFSFTAIDENLDSAILYLGNGSYDSTNYVWLISNATFGFASAGTGLVNNTLTNFTGDGIHGVATNPDNSTGIGYNIWINDSAGNSAYLYSDNTTLYYVDTVAPSQFNLSAPRNNTYFTDFTPTFIWDKENHEDDWSFGNITVSFDNDSTMNSIEYQGVGLNNSDILTVGTVNNVTIDMNDTNFEDGTWYWNATVIDNAGWTNTSVNGTQVYLTDSTCANLTTGWNACGFSRDTATVTSKTILEELGNISNSQIVLWNASHDWQIHIQGQSTFNALTYTFGDPLFIYNPNTADMLWEGRYYNDSAFDGIDASGTGAIEMYNFTNTSDSGWNTFAILNSTGRTFRNLNDSIHLIAVGQGVEGANQTGDGNVNKTHPDVFFFSYFNNTAVNGSKYQPYVQGINIEQETFLDTFEVVFGFLNASIRYNTSADQIQHPGLPAGVPANYTWNRSLSK